MTIPARALTIHKVVTTQRSVLNSPMTQLPPGGEGQAVNGGPLPSIPNCFVHTLKFYKPIYIQPYGKMSAWLCMLTCNFLLFCKSI